MNPYLPPEHGESPPPIDEARKAGQSAPLIGCVSGGCLLPILLFFACAFFLGDTGGSLVWPIFAVPLGIIGLIAGFIYRAARQN
jgi:hypothetical protein